MALNDSVFDDVTNSVKDNLEDNFNYIAVGDDDTPATSSDASLGNETFRVARIDVDKTTIADEIIITGEIGYGENNGSTIREVGWFVEGGTTTDIKSRDVLVTEIVKTSDISVVLPKRIKIEVIESGI